MIARGLFRYDGNRKTHLLVSLLAVLLAFVKAADFSGTLRLSHVLSKYAVPGGYIALRDQAEQKDALPQKHPCYDYARSLREPFGPIYWKRASLDEVYRDIPRAFWKWDGNFSRAQFESAMGTNRVVNYKIIGGRIYINASHVSPEESSRRKELVDEMLVVTSYLFPLPDMEFLLHFGDGCMPGHPALVQCACRDVARAGFTLPSFALWRWSLGPTQMAAYHSCLRERYPVDQRKPLVIWRGSSTGRTFPGDLETCLKMVRVRLHMLSRGNPDVLDARLVRLVQECAPKLEPLINDTAPRLFIEDFNQYCAVIDLDGNTWSERIATHLVHFPTPILKMATNFTSSVDHFFAPGVVVEEFDDSLSSLVDKARRLIADCKSRKEFSAGQAMARRAQSTARMLLDHMGVIKATAYALANYKRLTGFPLDSSLDGFVPLQVQCCKDVDLPPEVIAAVNSMQLRPRLFARQAWDVKRR